MKDKTYKLNKNGTYTPINSAWEGEEEIIDNDEIFFTKPKTISLLKLDSEG